MAPSPSTCLVLVAALLAIVGSIADAAEVNLPGYTFLADLDLRGNDVAPRVCHVTLAACAAECSRHPHALCAAFTYDATAGGTGDRCCYFKGSEDAPLSSFRKGDAGVTYARHSDNNLPTAQPGGDCGVDVANCPAPQCCSQWGSCGLTLEAYCGSGCQSAYGACSTSTPTPAATPTPTPVPSPTPTPVTTPTPTPVASPTPAPVTPSGDGSLPPDVKAALLATDSAAFLISQQPGGGMGPSIIYQWPDAIKAMTAMYLTGVAGSMFWLGGGGDGAWKYGMASFAAFIAQSMKETILYDACDENNWDSSSGRLPATNACGQLGQSYQDYKCPAGQEQYDCEIDPSMEMRAATHATHWGAAPPLFCAPKSKIPAPPTWDAYGADCSGEKVEGFPSLDAYIDYASSGGTCRDYDYQKGGSWVKCAGGGCPNTPAPNFGQATRTDLEGCCFWGRGVIQTTGSCNFGKLNWFIGAKAKARTGNALFGNVDFCRNPQAVCSDPAYPELKWVAGLYYYMTEVQSWADSEFNYIASAKAFVDGGMAANDNAFIDAVSGVVNRGCARAQCPSGEVDGIADRRANFRKVLAAMHLV